jgi:hypothetical protein
MDPTDYDLRRCENCGAEGLYSPHAPLHLHCMNCDKPDADFIVVRKAEK